MFVTVQKLIGLSMFSILTPTLKHLRSWAKGINISHTPTAHSLQLLSPSEVTLADPNIRWSVKISQILPHYGNPGEASSYGGLATEVQAAREVLSYSNSAMTRERHNQAMCLVKVLQKGAPCT
jgi:hypothetical protein